MSPLRAVRAGSTTVISASELRASDVDSEDGVITFRLRQDPTAGRLRYRGPGRPPSPLSVAGPTTSFTQQDIDQGTRLLTPYKVY